MPKRAIKRTATATESNDQYLRVRLKALEIPPIKDGVVIGRGAAIGAEALRRTMKLISREPFDHFSVKDDIISDVIIRASVLKKITREKCEKFILTRVKPVMSETELLMLDIEIEVVMEASV
ncbi:MAG TPA: hypothetical protein VKC60_13075 [Opitutaceae bacterium]|nr:hypothetical protein [Opitutaceae bacterium]